VVAAAAAQLLELAEADELGFNFDYEVRPADTKIRRG
jgi:hypothetical protein